MREPTLKILFTGLLDFYIPPTGTMVEIGALREDSHCLSIGIQKFVDDTAEEPPKILTYYEEPEGGECAEVIEGGKIRLEVTGATGDVVNHAGDLILFDGPEFHEYEIPIPCEDDPFRPIITIDAGNACTLYSAQTARVKKERRQYRKSITITTFVGADINLTSGSAVLRYGQELEREYPMPYSENTRYVMFVENSCLGRDDKMEDNDESDFKVYYKYFLIHPDKQFELKKESRRIEPGDEIITRVRNCVWPEEDWKRRIDNPCDPIGTGLRYWTPQTP